MGFVFSDGRRREVLIELGNFAVIAVLSFLGLWVSARWLIVGYFAHGGWDLVHHPRARLVQTRVSEWYVAACVAYDWIIGGFLLFWLT